MGVSEKNNFNRVALVIVLSLVVGIGVATLFTFNEKTILVGIVLLGAAIGIVVYQLYKQRLDFPTN